MAEEAAAAPKQQFAVQKIYLKDASLESPKAPAIFGGNLNPQVKVDINTRAGKLQDARCEVVVTITITAEQDDATVFLIEVQQAGLFHVAGFPDEHIPQVLGIACPNLLFPYARQAVDQLAVQAGFPAINLQPVNFEALFLQAQKAARESAGGDTTRH